MQGILRSLTPSLCTLWLPLPSLSLSLSVYIFLLLVNFIICENICLFACLLDFNCENTTYGTPRAVHKKLEQNPQPEMLFAQKYSRLARVWVCLSRKQTVPRSRGLFHAFAAAHPNLQCVFFSIFSIFGVCGFLFLSFV